jgi:hypothetical protein
MKSIIHHEVTEYIHDDSLCFDDIFPVRSRLTGHYYISSASYSKHVNPVGLVIAVQTKFTEYKGALEEDIWAWK